MDPKEISKALTRIADYIDNTPSPSRVAVASDLQALLDISATPENVHMAGLWEKITDLYKEKIKGMSTIEIEELKQVEAKAKRIDNGTKYLKDMIKIAIDPKKKLQTCISTMDDKETADLAFSQAIKNSRNDIETFDLDDSWDGVLSNFVNSMKAGKALSLCKEVDVHVISMQSSEEGEEWESQYKEFRGSVAKALEAYLKELKAKGSKAIKQDLKNVEIKTEDKSEKPDTGKDESTAEAAPESPELASAIKQFTIGKEKFLKDSAGKLRALKIKDSFKKMLLKVLNDIKAIDKDDPKKDTKQKILDKIQSEIDNPERKAKSKAYLEGIKSDFEKIKEIPA
jgi:hypothetical protein